MASSLSTQVPVEFHVGHGVEHVATEKIHTQGNMKNTGNDLDISIDGPGFFSNLQPNGTIAYSRAGHFNVDGQGRLVTDNGMLLDPEINIPPETRKVEIGFDGTVSVFLRDETLPEAVGSMQLARFSNTASNPYWKKFVPSHSCIGQSSCRESWNQWNGYFKSRIS